MSKFEDLLAQLRGIKQPQQAGKVFELLCEHYLRARFPIAKQWSAPWPTNTPTPNGIDLAGSDTGIDLIAMDDAGNAWGVQAKALATNAALQKKHLDSFIADTIVRRINKRLVITTAKKISKHAAKYVKELACEVIGPDDLARAAVQWPETLPQLAKTIPARNTSGPVPGWLPHQLAREYARALRLRTQKSWRLFVRSGRKRADVPATPDRTYRQLGWIDWDDFLGTGNHRKKNWRTFEVARQFASGLGLQSVNDWRHFVAGANHSKDIPRHPDLVYRKLGWISWGDFLGTGTQTIKNWRTFEEAHQFVLGLELKSRHDWRCFCASAERPRDIPTNPNSAYREKGWTGWGDFLGTGNTSKGNFMSYQEARTTVHTYGLKSVVEWRRFCGEDKKPKRIPATPAGHYKDKGWVSWGDFLGTNRIARGKVKWRPFKKARSFARSLGLTTYKEWTNFACLPSDVPRNPENIYKHDWKGREDWIGFRVRRTE
jgi:hypothetical protein